MQERNVNENHNGVGHPQVIFSDGVGMQKTNGDYEDDGDIGDDENEEVSFKNIFNKSFIFKPFFTISYKVQYSFSYSLNVYQ